LRLSDAVVAALRSTVVDIVFVRSSSLPEKNCFAPAYGAPRSRVTSLGGRFTSRACGFLELYSCGPRVMVRF
jgi:hypothetical protein